MSFTNQIAKGRVFILCRTRQEFTQWCRDNALSPREHAGETFFVDEGYRLRSQPLTPNDQWVYLDSWQYRSGAKFLLNDFQSMIRRRDVRK